MLKLHASVDSHKDSSEVEVEVRVVVEVDVEVEPRVPTASESKVRLT